MYHECVLHVWTAEVNSPTFNTVQAWKSEYLGKLVLAVLVMVLLLIDRVYNPTAFTALSSNAVVQAPM